jgi:hypothetical protein
MVLVVAMGSRNPYSMENGDLTNKHGDFSLGIKIINHQLQLVVNAILHTSSWDDFI